jgi:microcystin-dependent protein
MSEYFMGQIMLTGFGFAPKYFAQCNGQLLSVSQNQALFSLLGTNYGGNGIQTFALPDLRSRAPAGGGYPSSDPAWQPATVMAGQAAGTENVTLLSMQIPSHNHQINATTANAATEFNSGSEYLAKITGGGRLYGDPAALPPLSGGPLTPSGGTQPHPNMQPYETINFNIALYGIYPSRG